MLSLKNVNRSVGEEADINKIVFLGSEVVKARSRERGSRDPRVYLAIFK